MLPEVELLNDLDQLRSRYDVLGRLGHDGADVVYKVKALGTDRHLAVKLIPHSEARRPGPAALEAWQAHTVKPLEHPGLISLHAVHHLQGGAVALAMERRRARTVAEVLERDGSLPPHRVERVLREVGAALGYLHSRGVVHRGVRLHSIHIDAEGGDARLSLFGVDKGDATIRQSPAALARASAFLAPEQIAASRWRGGARVRPQTDLYSLGLVAYAMLSGRPPWTGDSVEEVLEKRRTEGLQPLTELVPDLPNHLSRAIAGCLERSPRRRWKSAEEFLAALDAHGESAPPVESEVERVPGRERVLAGVAAIREAIGMHRGKHSRAVLGAGSAFVLIMSLAGLLAMRSDPEGRLVSADRSADVTPTPPAVEQAQPDPSAALAEIPSEPLWPVLQSPTLDAGEALETGTPGRSSPASEGAARSANRPRGVSPLGTPINGTGRVILLGDPIADEPAGASGGN